ncbi:MAG TPA: glycerophosphodiester phosphodiesterase, partial [Baekduia sp.]|nr:glycerophosphodiester phosphodiesterase [Baekduia sp.]
GNTLASFDAALTAGVDMIEFDVIAEHRDGSGTLLVAHDYGHVAGAPTLDEALAHLGSERFSGIELGVDLKLPGYEDRVVGALRSHGVLDRALISTMELESLPRLRALGRDVRVGWSVPKVKRNYLASPWTRPLAYVAIGWLRLTLPRRLSRAIQAGAVDAAMAHQAVVTKRFVDAVHAAGGEIYVWTVDDTRAIAKFRALGVDGITTNDPRLFAQPAESVRA